MLLSVFDREVSGLIFQGERRMQILIYLVSENHITVKQSYNNLLQGLIYQFLDRLDANWLHENGFASGNRNFKLFVFSGIRERGKIDRKTKTFEFSNRISFYLSSPVDWILTQFSSNIIRARKLNLGNNSVSVESIAVMKEQTIDSDSIIIRALTPIEVHSTLIKPDGKKLTYYYSPFEGEFGKLVNTNLRKKWKAFYRREAPGDISVKPLFSGIRNERIRYFASGNGKTLIKGWVGRFELSGDKELLKFALDAGLGSRNSQGFGMIKIAADWKNQ